VAASVFLVFGIALANFVERLEVSMQANVRLYEDALAALRSRDEFLALASHELRTPVASLVLARQKLDRDLKQGNAKGGERSLALIGRQTARLTALMNQLLDVSVIQSGRLLGPKHEVDLRAVAQGALELLSLELARAHCDVHLVADQPVIGQWDAVRVEQVVINLVSNALKYGPGKPIDVEVRREGDAALLQIRDRGAGIAPEALPRLFEKFFRSDPTRRYGGLGLGLYLTQRIIEEHGGSVEVESQMGIGSTFKVRLPLQGTEALTRVA
jgi:signal transduction histidine kinase